MSFPLISLCSSVHCVDKLFGCLNMQEMHAKQHFPERREFNLCIQETARKYVWHVRVGCKSISHILTSCSFKRGRRTASPSNGGDAKTKQSCFEHANSGQHNEIPGEKPSLVNQAGSPVHYWFSYPVFRIFTSRFPVD